PPTPAAPRTPGSAARSRTRGTSAERRGSATPGRGTTARSCGPPPGPEPRATRPRIALDLLLRGAHGLAGERLPEWRAAADAHRQLRRADARPAPLAEGVLDHAVLEGVVRDDDQHAAVDEGVPQGGQGSLQGTQLVVYRDPDGLEDPGLVPGGRGPAIGDRHGRHQLVARREALGGTALDDLTGEPPRPRLLAEVAEHLHEHVLVGLA